MAPSRVRAVMCDGNRMVAEAVARSQGGSAEQEGGGTHVAHPVFHRKWGPGT